MLSTTCSIQVWHPSGKFCIVGFMVPHSQVYRRKIDFTVGHKKLSWICLGKLEFQTRAMPFRTLNTIAFLSLISCFRAWTKVLEVLDFLQSSPSCCSQS